MDIHKISKALFKMPNVKAAILFGSQAKGRARKDSDMDICVITKNEDDSPLLLSSEKTDISLFHRLPNHIRYRIFKDGKLLFCKDDQLLTNLKFWTIKIYLDEKHWRDISTARVLA
ncbi:MAG: nucleotidyltransferase domain-containing protein [Candidatus Micrarchaeota archaeon]